MTKGTGREACKMSANAKIHLIYISIGFCLILGVESYTGGSNDIITVQRGGSVTIPCHYDEKYTRQKKFWFTEIGKTNKYANTTEENLSVIDHPDQSLFTVTMRNLQYKHTGHHYCVVETGEDPPTKVIYEPYIKIKYTPDVSVKSSSVSQYEGGNVSVQCFYSFEYKKKLKRWCTFKDKRCFSEKKTDTSQNSSVRISDDGESSFTVLMTGLRLSDSGWYFCSVGEQILPVQLTVNEAETSTVTKTIYETGINMSNETVVIEDRSNDLLTVWLPVSAALLLLLLVLAAVFIWIWRRRPKQDEQKTRQRNSSSTTDAIYSKPEDPVVYITINEETPNDITYSTIDIIPGSEAKPPTGGSTMVIYSAVA